MKTIDVGPPWDSPLGLIWGLNTTQKRSTCLKPSTTSIVRHNYLNFHLDDKKHSLKTANCEIIKHAVIYIVVSANHGSWTPLGTLHWVAFEDSTRARNVPERFWPVFTYELLENYICLRMSLTRSLFLLFHMDLENELGTRPKMSSWLQIRWWIWVSYEGLKKGQKSDASVAP